MGNCLSSILSVLFSSTNDSRIKREYTPVNNVNSSISAEKLDFVSSMHDQSVVGEILKKPSSYNSINDGDYSSSASANSQHVYSSQNDVSFSGPSTASYNSSSQYQQNSQGFSNSDNRVNIQLPPPLSANGLAITGFNSTTHMSIPAPPFSISSVKPKQGSGAAFSTKYDLRDEVGVGSTSKCYKCIRKSDGKEFACKVIDKRNVEMKFSGLLDQFFVEIKVLQTLNHPNIIRLQDTFETPDRIFMVMEMMKGGELFDYVVEKGTLSEEEASILVRKITSAVAHMHSLNIIHRDLKPENLLLTIKANSNSNINTNNNAGKSVGAGDAEVFMVITAPPLYVVTNYSIRPHTSSQVKLIDFGLAKVMDESVASSFLGTKGYLAPEMLQRLSYGKAVDMWALGVIVFVLLCGCLPFDDDSSKITSEQAARQQRHSNIVLPYQFTILVCCAITRKRFALRFPQWAASLSASAKDLLEHLLEIDPDSRFTANQALQHPWVSGKAVQPNHYLESPCLLG